MTWTLFYDMHSGGSQKLKWSNIYIEAPQGEAESIFYNRFGNSPNCVSCTCCGEDYFIEEYETLEKASANNKHVVRDEVLVIREQEIKPEERVGGALWEGK